MAFLHRHSGPVDARFLEVRVALFTIGAVLGMAGIYLDTPWMVGVAIGVLAVGFVIRFVPRRKEESRKEGGEVDGDDAVG